MNNRHAQFMERALFLAEQGRGWVSPNPLVGCVIVNKGRIVGEGYHRAFGGPHAEVHAFAQAGTKAKGGTAYITLEPCTHYGKTPPCAPLVINSGIKNVFIAMKDPNPVVSGQGIKALKKAGIHVMVGLKEPSAQYQNRSYLTWRTLKRPHVVLKAAMTLDGKIATAHGESRWISGESSRQLVHKLRAQSDAVLVGAQTAQKDNPRLTSHGGGRNPLRMVLDPQLRTSPNLHLYRDKKARTTVVVSDKASSKKAQMLQKRGVQILRQSLKSKNLNLINLLRDLSNDHVSQLLVEGGGTTNAAFLEQGLVDEVYLFIAPFFLGGSQAPTPFEGRGFLKIAEGPRLQSASVVRLDNDFLIHGFLGQS